MAKIQNAASTGVALMLENDGAAPWTESGLPDQSSRDNVIVSITDGKPETVYEVHLELHASNTAWFIDEVNPDARAQTKKIFVEGGQGTSISVADSVTEQATVMAFINFGPGAGQSNPTTIQVSFVAPSPDSIDLQLMNNGAEAGGDQAITATVTAVAKNRPIKGATIWFELQSYDDGSARFLQTPGLNISDDARAWGVSDENGQVSASFVDRAADEGEIVVHCDSDSGGRLADDKPFSFKLPDGLKIEAVALSTTTDGSGTWVEWDASEPAKAAADGVAAIQVFALVTNKDGNPWKRGRIQFTLSGTAQFIGSDPDVALQNDNRVAIAPLGYYDYYEGGTTPYLSFTCATRESGSITALILNTDSAAPDITTQVNYQFTDPWTSVTGVESKFPNSDDMHRFIVADGKDSTDLQVNVRLTSPNGVPLSDANMPDNAFANAKLIAYDDLGYGYNELGNGPFRGWSYTSPYYESDSFGAGISGSNDSPIAKATEISPKGAGQQGTVYTIRCSGTDNAADYKFGLDITPTGLQILSTGATGPHGYPRAKAEPTQRLLFCESGNTLSSSQQKIISRTKP